jgi:presenilin-like A22 family membrane protease
MKSKIATIVWSGFIMAATLALALFVATAEKPFFEANQVVSPYYSLGPVIIYFFAVVAIMAVFLFFIPLRWLKYVFKILFTLMFAWGVFWVIFIRVPAAPLIAAYVVAALAGLVWLLWARIWLHNLLLIIALAGAGSVFGFLFHPWTFMIFMLIIAVYDLLAVRFGFMTWMADRLSETASLPAFVFPKQVKDSLLNLNVVRFGELKDKPSGEREYSVMGGGDIGFPIMLAVSVYFAQNLASAIIVGAFGIAGLVGAFLIQMYWLKGKPAPGLPPISFMCLVGFLITLRWFA